VIVSGTPVEQVDERIWVKREDLCCPLPGPEFAKIRGVYSHIKNRPEDVIGVLDTYHSKAGWAAKALRMKDLKLSVYGDAVLGGRKRLSTEG